MTIEEINIKKSELLAIVEPLIKLKKKLYSNMPIESAMSKEEKELNNKINSIFSEINSLVMIKRKLLKATPLKIF